MSEAFASVFPWIPEDDVLLKKSVEEGASLLALAKGAVKFSRKFSLQELCDRWHSLLFNPDVSAEASFRMERFEFLASDLSSASKKFGNSKTRTEVLGKRKFESIRSLYYAMRKKLNIEISNSTDLCSPLVLNKHVCIADISGFPHYEQLEPKPSFKNSTLGLQDTNCCVPSHARPNSAGEDNPSSKMTNNDGLFDFPTDYSHLPSEETGGNETRLSFDESILEKGQNDAPDSANAASKCDFLYLSDSLLNFENEEHTFMEMGLKNIVDNDNASSYLLCSDYDQEGEIPGAGECNALASRVARTSGDACSGELHCFGNHKRLEIPQSAPIQTSRSAEVYDAFMHCRLNAEDPDIPDNDDIMLSMEIATAFPSLMESNSIKPGDRGSPSNSKEGGLGLEHGLMIKRHYPAKPFRESKHIEFNSLLKTDFSFKVSEVKSAIPGQIVVRKHYEGIDSESTVTKREGLYPFASDFQDPSSDLREYESDGDIPYFSDVETMVLDMDLETRNESEYPKTNMRKLMRFEQCANSSLHRHIVRRGAFAVLVGHHLKYYIKKAEITLGRATDDMDVDVDLSREGKANKISRLQAVLKLQRDGSFCLKNVGRGSVFVNGKGALTGQLLKLTSSCLIEIRGLNFMFEVSHKAAIEYVASIGKEFAVRKNNK